MKSRASEGICRSLAGHDAWLQRLMNARMEPYQTRALLLNVTGLLHRSLARNSPLAGNPRSTPFVSKRIGKNCSLGNISPALRVRGGVRGLGGNGASTRGRQGAGAGGGDVPPYARSPPRDGVLYDELEVHWGASARYVRIFCLCFGFKSS